MADRIVSLAPSATAILRELGAEAQLVGVTTRDGGAPAMGGWLTADPTQVVDADPDLVITTDALQRSLAETLEAKGLDVAHFEPQTLPAVYAYIRDLGERVDRSTEAAALADRMETRIEAVRAQVADAAAPVVYCEEWGDPPMVAGNWVPEVIAAAGGRHPFCDPGERSRRIAKEELEAADPAHALIHHCGQGTAIDPDLLDARGWSIPSVHVIDDDLLNMPAPSLADAVERIASLLHPDVVIETP